MQCHYKLTFGTPLVCDHESMAIYPTLDTDLQAEWDVIESDMNAGFISHKVRNIL